MSKQLNNLDPVISQTIATRYFDAVKDIHRRFIDVYGYSNIPTEKMAQLLFLNATDEDVRKAKEEFSLKTKRMSHQEFDEMTIKGLDKAKKS